MTSKQQSKTSKRILVKEFSSDDETDQALLSPFSAKEEKTVDSGALSATDSPVPRFSLIGTRAHAALRGMSGKKPIIAYLSYFSRTTGAANSAFATTVPLQPNLDSSWTSWQGVFDEMKVLKAEHYWKVVVATSATAAPTQAPNTVMAYDPTSVALTSVNGGLEFESFQLVSCAYSRTDSFPSVPAPITKGGFMKFVAKVPRETQLSNTDTLLSAGQWRPTQDAVNYNWGSMVAYTSQGGATCQLSVESFTRLHVEFRVRR